jgi:hypothetical protein
MSWRRTVGVAFTLAALAGLPHCAFLLYVCRLFRGWFDDPKDGFRAARDAERIRVCATSRSEARRRTARRYFAGALRAACRVTIGT